MRYGQQGSETVADAETPRTDLTEESPGPCRKVADPASQLSEPGEGDRDREDRHNRQYERECISTQIEFIGDFDIVTATSVDISEGGVCFDVPDGLPFEMQFEVDGVVQRHRAQIAWMKRLPEGGYRLGFKFVSSEPEPVI